VSFRIWVSSYVVETEIWVFDHGRVVVKYNHQLAKSLLQLAKHIVSEKTKEGVKVSFSSIGEKVRSVKVNRGEKLWVIASNLVFGR
jgi:hypothetical protein